MDIQRVMDTIMGCRLRKGQSGPCLLFDREEVAKARRRADERSDVLTCLRRRCDRLLTTPAEDASDIQVRIPSSEAVTMAEGTALLETDAYVDWVRQRIEALCTLDTWMAPVHTNGHCDHVMTNVAAHIAYALDLLGDLITQDERARVAADMRRLFLEPFPIRRNPHYKEAGLAFLAAGELGRFWEFVRHAYDRFETFDPAAQVGWAEAVGLDGARFEAVMADKALLRKLSAGKRQGLDNGVTATPALFVDGHRYLGELAVPEIVEVLEEAHERSVAANHTEGELAGCSLPR